MTSALSGLLFFLIPQTAQNINDPIYLTRITSPIVIDGHVDEPAWEAIDPVPLVSYDPVSGLPPSEPTEIRIGYDDHYIFASIRAYDSNPSGIRANTLTRDRLSGDDVFHILLDTYNDNESAMAFTITPTGAKRDATISNDGEGPRAMNADFMTYWDVATHINDKGWFAEVRIPFSSLGFQDDNGRVEMGLLFQRGIARKNERVTFPEVPANVSRPFFKPSLGQRIVFEGIYSSRPLHITPYLLGGLEQNYRNNEDQSGYSRIDDTTLEAGFDIKYGITNNLTLDLTVNTDFAQVEADDQQVNLTRFALFLPEKRQFFQERSDLFDVNMGGSNRLFYSRRIGLRDGQQIRILGGARLTGSVGSWDVGLLNMQTAREGSIPSENFGAFRLRRNVLNPNSFVGTMFSSRVSTDGTNNYSFGVDGTLHLFGDDYLSFQYGQVVDSELEYPVFAWDTSRMRIDWQTRRIIGWGYGFGISRNGVLFIPGAGFAGRLNYTRFGPELNYGWRGSETSRFQNHQVAVGGNIFLVDHSGDLESINMGAEWTANWESGSRLTLELTYNHENLVQTFWITGEVPIPADQYRFVDLELNFNTPEGGLYSAEAEVVAGQFFDGYRFSASISSRLSFSRHFNLQPLYEINRIEFPDRNHAFTTHIGRVRAEYFLNNQFSIRSFIQYSNASELVLSNIRLRFNPREGNDFYILFNENLNTNRLAYSPVRPVSQYRAILMKYNYTF